MQRAKLKPGDIVGIINYKHTHVANAKPAIIMDMRSYDGRRYRLGRPVTRRTQYIGIAQQNEFSSYYGTEEEARAFAAPLSGEVTVEYVPPPEWVQRRGEWRVSYHEWLPAAGYLPHIVGTWDEVLSAKVEFEAKRAAEVKAAQEATRIRGEQEAKAKAERDARAAMLNVQRTALAKRVLAPWKALGIKAQASLAMKDGQYINCGVVLDENEAEKVLRLIERLQVES